MVTDGGVAVCRAILKALGTGVVVAVKERAWEGEGGRDGVYVRGNLEIVIGCGPSWGRRWELMT
jgi:hypothetical protein